VATSDLGRLGADLFSRVAATRTSGDAASLSAAELYRKALHLLPDDGSTRTALEAALNAVEERNRRTFSAPAVVRAAIVAETYDPEARAENPLGDRVVSYLLTHGITCDQVLPRSIEKLKELPERYDLIMHGGPRSPRPQGQLVLEIFGDSKDFEQLYLHRKHDFSTWDNRYFGATWVLFAGNGILLTMEAADRLVESGSVASLVRYVRGDVS
jgi:hypothetical protein